MNYDKQIEEFVSYFKNSETNEEDFKVGVEFEHFIIDKDTLYTISYYGENGVEETLKELEGYGWVGNYEGEHLLGLSNENRIITLEPGSQIELSINPQKNIQDLENEYFSFLRHIIPILESKNQALITVGYHPISKIEEIKIIPKKRYDYMYEYFKTKGIHAHNMMKGTASLQVAIDYKSEEDYVKKFKIANALSPVLYTLFDNGYYFEEERWGRYNLRSFIWQNCDNDRTGIVPGTFDNNFGYRKYAEYILNVPPIFVYDGENTYPTGKKLVREIFDPENYSIAELEHMLTMVFPDVRTKKYIEIRMMDSVPYPLNFAAVVLLKGIFYNDDNLSKIYEYVKNVNMEDVIDANKSISKKGLNGKLKEKTIHEIGNWLITLAKDGLNSSELKYIQPLEEMIKDKKNPYEIIREKEHLGKKESLNCCILDKSLIKTFK